MITRRRAVLGILAGSTVGISGCLSTTRSDSRAVWTFDTDGPVSASPTVADGAVYVGSDDNHVYALDTSDGTEQWRVETRDQVRGSPTVVDETVYVGSDDFGTHHS